MKTVESEPETKEATPVVENPSEEAPKVEEPAEEKPAAAVEGEE